MSLAFNPACQEIMLVPPWAQLLKDAWFKVRLVMISFFQVSGIGVATAVGAAVEADSLGHHPPK